MSLPDLSRLLDLEPQIYAALHARLHALGIGPKTVDEAFGAMRTPMADPMRRALRLWRARQDRGARGHAVRCFLVDDPITVGEAREMLGEIPLDRLIEAGLLSRRDDGVVSPLNVSCGNDMYFLGDHLKHGGDAVMGPGVTTAGLCQAAHPTRRIARVLDLGCGSGTLGLMYARQAERVIGTDINARAVLMSQINARLNGITNAEFRVGSLYEPVAGESFDLIVSQPPFVARPKSAPEATFLFGGPRGDEIPMNVLEGAPSHLAPGGRAICLIEFPLFAGEDEGVIARVRSVVPQDDVSVLLIENRGRELDDSCIWYSHMRFPALGPDYDRDVVARRSHFAEMNAVGLKLTFAILERTDKSRRFDAVRSVETLKDTELTGGRIDAILSGQRLARGSDDEMLAAALQLPPGTSFTEQHVDGETKLVASFSASAMIASVVLTRGLADLLSRVATADSVQRALQEFADTHSLSLEVAARRLLPPLRDALVYGMVEPREP